VLLVAPTLIVLVTSFTSAYSLKFPPPGYSPRWYLALWNDSPEILAAAQLSVEVAALATAIATVLAVAGAVALARRREAWARVLDAVFMSPLMLPTLALGLALLVLFNVLGRGLSMTTLVIGHVAICTPYILRTTTASLLQLDPALLDSARSLGARPWFTFRTVTLPLVAPGVAPARSSRSWRRSTTSRSRYSCPTREAKCSRSACGTSSKPTSTSEPPPRRAC
jgi:putative spermidine/putrescine transport system permease protein